MNALVMNCSPVRNGATAEIVELVFEQLSAKYDVKKICILLFRTQIQTVKPVLRKSLLSKFRSSLK